MLKKLISLLLVLAMLGSFAGVSADSLIKDISKSSSYATDAILRMEQQGIIKGDENGNFNPQKPITRGEIVTMLIRALNIDISKAAPGTATFNDVPLNHWANKYVEAAYTEGIVNGVSPTEFGINNVCTREQLAVMFVRALRLSQNAGDLSYQYLNKLSDKDSIAGWAQKEAELAMQNGLMNGTSPTTFGPKLYATREQAAVMLDRLLKNEALLEVARQAGSALGQTEINGNNVNKGLAVESDDTIFFTPGFVNNNYPPTTNKLYSVKAGETEPATLLEDQVAYINVVGDWVYYKNLKDSFIYKVHKDGTEKTLVTNDIVSTMTVSGDWIYYSGNAHSDYGLYKIKLDGTEKTHLGFYNAESIDVKDGWIYFNYNNSPKGIQLFRMRTDGSSITLLTYDQVKNFDVYGPWIYYIQYPDDRFYFNDYKYIYSGRIYKIRLDGTGRTRVNDNEVNALNVSEGWIYYSLKDDSYQDGNLNRVGLYKMRLDGSENTKLMNYYASNINVTGDWIYFVYNDGLWRMKKDGSGMEWAGIGNNGSTPPAPVADVEPGNGLQMPAEQGAIDMSPMAKQIIKDGMVFNSNSNYALVSGEPIKIDSSNSGIKPYIYENPPYGASYLMYYPLKFITDNMGAMLEQNGDSYVVTYNDKKVVLTIGKPDYTVNDTARKSIIGPMLKDNTVYVDKAILMDIFGFSEISYYKEQSMLRYANSPRIDSPMFESSLHDNILKYFGKLDTVERIKDASVIYVGSPYAIIKNKNAMLLENNASVVPIVYNNTILAPISFIADSANVGFNWDKATSTITINLNDKSIKLTVGSDIIDVDGNKTKMPAAVTISNGVPYVSVNALAQALGKEVFTDRSVVAISDAKNLINPVSEKDIVDTLISYFNEMRIQNLNAASKNSINNMTNGNRFVAQSGMVYYSRLPGNGLWKMKADGTGQVKLADGYITDIAVVDNWIYYALGTTVYKIKTDGTSNTLVVASAGSNDYLHNLYYYDKNIYYTDLNWPVAIYKASTEGIRYHDNRSQYMFGSGIDVLYSGNYIYYLNANDNYRIYRLDTSTNMTTRMNEQKSNYINVMDGYIYFSNGNDGNRIYRVKDSGASELASAGKVSFFNIYKIKDFDIVRINNDDSKFLNAYQGWIYYSNDGDKGALYKVKADGTSRIKLNNEASVDIHVIGDYIYYYSGGKTYRMKLDGTGRQLL